GGSRYSDQRRRGAGRGWRRHADRHAAIQGDAGDGHARHRARNPPRRHPKLLTLRQPARPAGQRDNRARGWGAPEHRRTAEALRRCLGAALLDAREPGEPGVRHHKPTLLRGAAHDPRLPAGRDLRRLPTARAQERTGLRRLALVRLGARVGRAALGRLGSGRTGFPHARRGALRILHERTDDLGDDLGRWRAALGPRARPPGAQGGARGEHAAGAALRAAARRRRAPVALL
ncbi:MAG: Uncharacterized DUF554 membrane protein, partial [uncultured Rubrobacteraceae bacterium]